MKRIIILLLVMIVICQISIAQNKNGWTPIGWSDSIYCTPFKGIGGSVCTRNMFGEIILKNKNTFQKCYLRPWLYSWEVLVLDTDTYHLMRIQNNDILFVRAKPISTHSDENYIEYNTLYKKRLFRLIKQKENISICDFYDEINMPEFGYYMILVLNKEKFVKIYGSFFWGATKNRKELILKFINKRYHQHFKESDFKTGMDMIDYILNKENEKLNRNVE